MADHYWDDAAASAYDDIVRHYTQFDEVIHLRRTLDNAIRNLFGQDPNGKTAAVWWAEIGKITIRTGETPERAEVLATVVAKQRDYGTGNILRFGNDGLLVRVHDKVARLENLLANRDGVAANEAISDTFLDIVGYSIIGIMLAGDTFTLPLREDVA
jgi:hypothetical protein